MVATGCGCVEQGAPWSYLLSVECWFRNEQVGSSLGTHMFLASTTEVIFPF